MKIGFIGCGNMGGALAKAASGEILLYDKSESVSKTLGEKIGARVLPTAKDVALEADFLFLGVKPAVIPTVLEELHSVLDEVKCTVVSMAAGVSIESIESVLGQSVPIIRIMPNTPASVGEGMILVSHNKHVTHGNILDFLEAMKDAGTCDFIDERLIDAASAVSGCGPAFVYMFIEALADGGVRCGLPRDKAMLYAEATVRGAATLALKTKQTPGALKDAVCSPGGTTIEGVTALENGAFRGTVINAVTAAYEKTLKMGK